MDDLIKRWKNIQVGYADEIEEDEFLAETLTLTIEALKPVEKLKGTCEKHPHLAVPVGCICHYCLDEERRICIQMLQAVVNKLQARIEELEERERWIPVSERVPADDLQPCLLLRNGKVEYSNHYPLFQHPLSPITHWKPIHPPQEDD